MMKAYYVKTIIDALQYQHDNVANSVTERSKLREIIEDLKTMRAVEKDVNPVIKDSKRGTP